VGETVELGVNRLQNARVAVTDVHHADAAGEVDVLVAVGVGQP
jgi:hypothetical protein